MQRGGIDIGRNDLRALRRHGQHTGPADTLPSSRYKGNLTHQTHIFSPLLIVMRASPMQLLARPIETLQVCPAFAPTQ
jgi:hypothetical protein